MSEKKKLKILCLHGYRQSAQTFRQKTGAFRKLLKSVATFEFVDAPNQIKTDEDDDVQLGWWFSASDRSYKAQDVTDCDEGFSASIQVVADRLKEDDFDGVLAFSQGASLLSVICAMQAAGDDRFVDKFRFAVFVSGFRSRQSCHQHHYKTGIALPSLHVMGEGDQVIEIEMSRDLVELYEDKTIVEHKGGHFVPATSQEKKHYVEFLKRFL